MFLHSHDDLEMADVVSIDLEGRREATVTSAADLLKLGADVIEAPRAGERIDLADVGTPLFVGLATAGPVASALLIESFSGFSEAFGAGEDGPFLESGALAHAVRGFFRNGGVRCQVMRLPGAPGDAVVGEAELAAIGAVSAPIIAMPDAHQLAGGPSAVMQLQRDLVDLGQDMGGRIVVLDPPPDLSCDEVLVWRRRLALESPIAVVYYPWVEVPAMPSGESVAVPPSGHVIGSWARLDVSGGVHQAATGQPLLGIDAPVTAVSAPDQRSLNRLGVNCLRSFPGPEPRVWGASTLSDDPDWHYLHRRRTYQQLMLSIALGTGWVGTTDPSEATLERLQAAVSALLQAAWRRGALQGATTGQAFSVHCDVSAEHPGHIALDLALALRQPGEFREVRLVLATAAAG